MCYTCVPRNQQHTQSSTIPFYGDNDMNQDNVHIFHYIQPIPSRATTCKNWKDYYVFKVKKKTHTPYSLLFSLGLNFQTFIDLKMARVCQIFIYERLVVFIFGNMADSLRTHIDCSYYLIHKPQRANKLFEKLQSVFKILIIILIRNKNF